ncbi:MAG: tetratricopeptide repeat protein, partial [Gammaproteobacteria bacterium]
AKYDFSRLKYINLLVHLLTGTVIFWFTGRLLQTQKRFAPNCWWIGLWLCAVWLIAPLFVSTVLYTVQRMAQLATLFCFCGLLCYVLGRQNLVRRFALGVALLISVLLLWWPLGFLSKENGALLPLLALLVEMFFFRWTGNSAVRKTLAVFFGIGLLLPAVTAAGILIVNPERIVAGYAYRDFTFIERLLTESRILFEYVSALLAPRGVSLGLYHDDYVVSSGLLSPPTTLISMLGWLGLLVITWRLRNHALCILLFGPVFFLAGHLLESTVFPLELYFEHRNYLPGYGIFFTLGLTAIVAAQSATRLRNALIMFMVALPVTYAIATANRVHTWSSLTTLIHTTQQSHPDSPRLLSDLAFWHAKYGDLSEALSYLDKTVAINPKNASGVALQRLYLHCAARTAAQAEDYKLLHKHLSFEKAPYVTTSFRAVADSVFSNGCPGVDASRIAAIVSTWLERIDPAEHKREQWVMRMYTAQLLAHTGDLPKALRHLVVASKLLPDRSEPFFYKLSYYLKMGRLNDARDTLSEIRTRHWATAETEELDRHLQRIMQEKGS